MGAQASKQMAQKAIAAAHEIRNSKALSEVTAKNLKVLLL
jgi:hypothetical protein